MPTHNDTQERVISTAPPVQGPASPPWETTVLCFPRPLSLRDTFCPLYLSGVWELPAERARASEGPRIHVSAVTS